MKKKIFLGLLLGALSFGSCVKDNESDAVKNQRDAQAKLILAEAKVKEADAGYKAAQAKKEEAQAKLEEALIQSKLDKATASATVATAEAAVEVENQKLNLEKAKAKFDAELAKAQAEAENIQAEATSLKVNNLAKLVAAVKTATTDYSAAVNSVTNKQDDIDKLALKIVKLKAGIVSASEYVSREKSEKEAELKAKELELEAYNDMVKSNFGTINEIKAKLFKKENELSVAEVNYKAEYDKVKASVQSGTSYSDAFEKIRGKELAKLTFFKNMKEASKLVREAAKGKKVFGYVGEDAADLTKFASKFLKHTEVLDGEKYILLFDNGTKVTVISDAKNSTEEDYPMYKERYTTNAELQDGLFDEAYVETAKGYFDLKIKDAKKELEAWTTSVTVAENAYTSANTTATTNTDTSQQATLDGVAQKKKAELAEAKVGKEKASKGVTEAENNKKEFEAAIAEIKKEANQKEVLAVSTKFVEEQKTLKGKLDELKKLYDKYSKLSKEKEALQKTVDNVAAVMNATGTGDSATKIAAKIKETEKRISEIKYEIVELENGDNSEDAAKNLVKAEEAKLERYKKELALYEKQLDAARAAYEAAIEALKKANA